MQTPSRQFGRGRSLAASLLAMSMLGVGGHSADLARPVRSKPFEVGRSEPCPCGSGKKFKKCKKCCLETVLR